MNMSFVNVPDFLKIGLMATLFLALVVFVISKIKPTASAATTE